ncbi:MAG: 5-(carboxyamino)imidazole ribonucleotide synthase [Ponticaulis sp.]|nr:5-(carboxyamino)imidazole ribonucleotide synthase [Ponticaulis sp.]
MTALPLGSTIGILGDGQLGRMLAGAAARLGFDVVILGPGDHSPASRVAAHAIQADYTDKDALAEFSVRSDLVTLEFENVPVSALNMLLDMGATVHPGPKSLEICQDRHFEKSFARETGVPTADYWVVDSVDDLRAAMRELQGGGILKTRRDGYDGHGQRRLKSGDDPITVYGDLDGVPCILEAMVPFAGEVSVVLARSATGEIKAYDPAENVHTNGILHTSRVPARFDEAVLKSAQSAATQLITALGHVGVLACEFFVLEDGGLLLNEMAPRVHNSGHWTPEACLTGQFEQHIRAIAGWPLGPTDRLFDAEMENLLGEDIYKPLAPGDMVTLYGKREARAGRKMGHVVRKT